MGLPTTAEVRGNIGQVKAFWEAEACGERYGDDQDVVRYEIEPEIVAFANSSSAAGKRVLEIRHWNGCGLPALGEGWRGRDRRGPHGTGPSPSRTNG